MQPLSDKGLGKLKGFIPSANILTTVATTC